MASKFLNNSNGVDLSALQDGTFSIYAKSIKVNDLDPNMNVSADQNKFLNSTNAGSGNMTYVGTTPSTNYILKADSADGLSVSKSNIRDDGTDVYVESTLKCDTITGSGPGGGMSIGSGMNGVYITSGDGVYSNAFTKTGGTNIQVYLGHSYHRQLILFGHKSPFGFLFEIHPFGSNYSIEYGKPCYIMQNKLFFDNPRYIE